MTAFLLRCLSLLPLPLLYRLGAVAGWLVYWVDGRYRRHLRENLKLALGRDDPSVRRRAVAEAGRQMLELPWILLRPQAEVVAKVSATGWDLVEAAHRDGAGILFLTPHLGCFEITAQHYAFASGSPITVLYRPPRKAVLAPIIQQGRSRGSMRLAPADFSGVRRLLKDLRNREAVGMLPDQVPSAGEGLWAPFFGRPAWTMTLAARLSEVKGVRVIYAWCERLPSGKGYVMHLCAPNEPMPDDLQGRCETINRELERLILLRPEQYLWGYNRYKQPRGAPGRKEQDAC